MIDTDDITSLQEQLTAHRRTLATLLRQVATHTAGYAPPAQISGIAEARREIARLKAALGDAGVAVEDQVGDEATAEEAGAQRAPGATVSIGRDQINAQGSQGFINQAQSVTQNFNFPPQPRPAIDPAQAQQLLDRLPLDQIPDPADLPPGSRMALLRNSLFVGREADLKAIAQQLKGGGAAAITTGIGGVGKTQLASEFAHRYGQFFLAGVFWLSFADPAGIDSEIAACGGAGTMELYTDAAGLTQAEQVAKVYAEWAQPIPRLLIFDNCDDTEASTAEALLAQWMPRSGGCRVLVTSRRGQWSRGLGIVALPLGVLGRAESIALLRSHRDDIGDDEADAIANELGDLPLALSLAGSYLESYHDEAFGRPVTYLANLRTSLLGHRSLSDAERSVRATFELSYQRLDAAAPVDVLAMMALARAAHLAPGEPFPRELLLATLGEETDDENIAAQRADALHRLMALGMLECAEDNMLRIHRLIAAYAQQVIVDDTAQAAVEQSVFDRASDFLKVTHPKEKIYSTLHMRYVTNLVKERRDKSSIWLCLAFGQYLTWTGGFFEAASYLKYVLSIYDDLKDHVNVTGVAEVCFRHLGLISFWQKNYGDAENYFYSELCGYVLSEDKDLLKINECLNMLGDLYKEWGRYEDACKYLELALKMGIEFSGFEGINTAKTLNTLGELFIEQNEIEKAKAYLYKSLYIFEKNMGYYSSEVSDIYINFAKICNMQGDLYNADIFYKSALEIRGVVFGDKSFQYAQLLLIYGMFVMEKGEMQEVYDIANRAISICENIFGFDNPHTLMARLLMMFVLVDTSEGAQFLDDLCIDLLKHQNDDFFASMISSTVGALLAFNRNEDSLKFIDIAKDIGERIGSHGIVAESLHFKGLAYRLQGNEDESRICFESAISICEKHLGSNYRLINIISQSLMELNEASEQINQSIIELERKNKKDIDYALEQYGEIALPVIVDTLEKQAQEMEVLKWTKFQNLAIRLRTHAAQLRSGGVVFNGNAVEQQSEGD